MVSGPRLPRASAPARRPPTPPAGASVNAGRPRQIAVRLGVMESTYFRRGFGLKAEIEGQLTADYHSTVVEALRARNYRLDVGSLSFRLAREFGFCYGVDRAVEYAYE